MSIKKKFGHLFKKKIKTYGALTYITTTEEIQIVDGSNVISHYYDGILEVNKVDILNDDQSIKSSFALEDITLDGFIVNASRFEKEEGQKESKRITKPIYGQIVLPEVLSLETTVSIAYSGFRKINSLVVERASDEKSFEVLEGILFASYQNGQTMNLNEVLGSPIGKSFRSVEREGKFVNVASPVYKNNSKMPSNVNLIGYRKLDDISWYVKEEETNIIQGIQSLNKVGIVDILSINVNGKNHKPTSIISFEDVEPLGSAILSIVSRGEIKPEVQFRKVYPGFYFLKENPLGLKVGDSVKINYLGMDSKKYLYNTKKERINR